MNTRTLLKTVMIVLFLVPAFSAYSAGNGSGDRQIEYIEVLDTGDIIIEAATNFNNKNNFCTHSDRIVLLASNEYRNLYYAAILTAYSTDRYIWAWLNGCWDAPWAAQYQIVVNVATLREAR